MTVEASEEEIETSRAYEAIFVPAIFAAWTEHVVEGADIGVGHRVLDVACGTGVLSRAALGRCGNANLVSGLDAAPGMIAVAREIEPGIDWLVGLAESLPFDDGSFDRIISQFGMMFFQNRQKAVEEAFRVARPAGRIAMAIWSSADQNPIYNKIASLLEEQVSSDAANAVRKPFCLGDPQQVTKLLADAGFKNIAVETMTEAARFPSSRIIVEADLRGWLPLFGINLNEEKIADVLGKSDALLSQYTVSTGEAVFQTSAYVVTAQKPG